MSSEDTIVTSLPTTMQTNNQPILQDNVSSSSSSSEEDTEKKYWVYMVQQESHGDHLDDLDKYYHRTLAKYKDEKLNNIYVTKVQIRLAYNVKRKEVKHPFTVFGIVTKEFRLLFSEKDQKVIYTDKEGTYLSHSDLHLRRYKVVWLTSSVVLFSFVYAHKKHAAIEFQVILECRGAYFYVRSKQVLLHYEELELPKLIPKTAYPDRIRNWYLFFE